MPGHQVKMPIIKNSSRNVYMQKKGLALNQRTDKEDMSRNPFDLNTEKNIKDLELKPVIGVAVNQKPGITKTSKY